MNKTPNNHNNWDVASQEIFKLSIMNSELGNSIHNSLQKRQGLRKFKIQNFRFPKFLNSFLLLFSLYCLLPRSADAKLVESGLKLSEHELEALPEEELVGAERFESRQVENLPSLNQSTLRQSLEKTNLSTIQLGNLSDTGQINSSTAESVSFERVAQQTIRFSNTDEGLSVAHTQKGVSVNTSSVIAQSSAENQPPTPNNQQPTPNPQPPTTSNQQPATDNQQPTTSNQQPTADQTAVRILSPQSGEIGTDSTNLVIQYPADTQIQISVNQKPLDLSKLSQTQQRDETTNLITQVWYNIPLKKGENTISVQSERTSASLQLKVGGTQRIANIEIAPTGDAQVRADGRSTLQLGGRITNEQGELIPEDAVVTLTASAGKFVGADADKDQAGFQVVAQGGQFTADLQASLEAQKVRVRAAIEANGKVIHRESERVGEFPPITPPAPDSHTQALEAYTQIEFITNLRPSLVSGVINLRIGPEGTNFWGRRRDFLNPNREDGYEFDLDTAIFATGKVGEWLFTGAYNSERPLNETCDGTTRLFRDLQFCDQPYPVYGDSSTVDYLTPSTDSVYLRLERTSPVLGAEPDYVMWGDYNTTEFARTSQLFTATNRALHGFKGNYNLGNLQITTLFSPDVEGFQRDTITPDGTSGYYFLSKRLLIEGSETVFIETEEINRPGTVLERKQLSRGVDYEIDYDRGTLLFRRPILAIDLDAFEGTRVRRIVATYQFEGGGGNETNIYAGRLQYNFAREFSQESFGALTYLREDQGDRDFELYGADFLVPLGKEGRIVGEYAHSTNNSLYGGTVTGNAYRLEANWGLAFGGSQCREGIGDLELGARERPSTTLDLSSNSSSCLRTSPTTGLSGRAYYRSVEEGFTNNATTSFTPGQTRYGATVAAQIGATTQLRATYDHEVNFGRAPSERLEFFDIFNPQPEPRPGEQVDNSLTTIRAGILQKIGASDLSLEYVNRSRDDRVSDTFDGDASQLVSRLRVPLTQALTFQAQNELNLGDSDPLYPNRTTLGLDWRAYKGVIVRLAHQFYNDGILSDNSITSLDTILEHKLGENTSLTGRYSIISGFNSVTGQGAVGLNHRWTIAPGLRLNLGYEHIFSDIFTETAAGKRFPQPYAVGQSAASLGIGTGDAYSVGLEYSNNPDFQASARFEHRTGEGGNNTVISASAAGKLSSSLTALARFEQANASNQLLRGRLGNTMNLRLGLAYRNPNSDKFNGLFKYEYRQNPSTIPESLLLGSGTAATEHLFSLEGIYAPSWRWEFYGKYALRNSNTFLSDDFENSSTVSLAQLRTTYRLGYRIDLAGEVRWIHQSDVGYNETGFALETGYYLTPDLRTYVGYSFGSVDDRDFSGYRSEGGVYFGLTFKVNELFGGFGRQKVVPRQQQESEVGSNGSLEMGTGKEKKFPIFNSQFPIPETISLAMQRIWDVSNVVNQLSNQATQFTDFSSFSEGEESNYFPTFGFLPEVMGRGETP